MNNELLEKINMFRTYNPITLRNEIVVYGSTYTAEFPFYELSKKYVLNHAIYNRSIAGLTLADAERYLQDCVLEVAPSSVFLSLGETDLETPDALAIYRRILCRIRAALPNTRQYVLSVRSAETGEQVSEFNERLHRLCRETDVGYLDIRGIDTADCHAYRKVFKRMITFAKNGNITFADAMLYAES